MKSVLWTFVVLASASLWSAAAAASETPAAVLKKLDAAVTKAKDQYMVYDLVTKEKGKPDRHLRFEVTIKGDKWRRIQFLAPGDVKGMRILVLSPSQTYVYLPAFHKIRRVASHVKEQGFMGSAYDNDDISLASYGHVFKATKLTDHPKYWTLELHRRPGVDFTYSKLVLDIRKDIVQAVLVRYFNDKGTEVKTEKRLNFSCTEGVCGPGIIDMVDHTRNDLESKMVRLQWKINQGVPDSFFTVRALQRGT